MKHFLLVAIFSFLQSFGQNDGWNILVNDKTNYTGVVLSNGRIGILPSEKPFEIKQIILNNVYDKASLHGVSRVLEGMNFGNLDIQIDDEKITEKNISNWSQTLNMKEASLTTKFNFKNKAEISYTIYALRNIPYSGYINVNINASKKIQIKVAGKIITPKEYLDPVSHFTNMSVLQTMAKSRMGKHVVGTSASFAWADKLEKTQRPKLNYQEINKYENQLSFDMVLDKNTNFEFSWTGAQCSTQDFDDPLSESERMTIFNLLTSKKDLLGQHKKLWANLWEGDIVIEGDLQTQQDVRLALYHLYSFAREDSNLSISPMGLSSQGYNGHIFWDTEIWMYPPLLVLNQGIAKSLLNYRFDRLDGAKQKATNYGYKGAMFPWESDDTGEEATPTWALMGGFEHHITADIGIAFWNYYRVTKDLDWLKSKGYPMLQEIAKFWVSRVTKNKDGSYSINNVIGANEHALNIDDNAFTNGSAITTLKYAILAAKELGVQFDKEWEEVANHIRIHKFSDGTTRENSEYKGETIKQADVNLLSYPLDIVSDIETIKKDLAYYEPKLDHDGPAMGKAIFAIIYARLGDSKNAYRLFKEGYVPNKRPPFGALSESPNSNNPYFATGAGGLLQTVLFGFGGLHLTNDGIIQKNPILPKEWKSLTIKGIGPDKKTFVID